MYYLYFQIISHLSTKSTAGKYQPCSLPICQISLFNFIFTFNLHFISKCRLKRQLCQPIEKCSLYFYTMIIIMISSDLCPIGETNNNKIEIQILQEFCLQFRINLYRGQLLINRIAHKTLFVNNNKNNKIVCVHLKIYNLYIKLGPIICVSL